MLTMRVLLLLTVLIFAYGGLAQSQEPSPAPPKSSHKPQANPKHHDQKPAQDQRGTESTPVFIKVIPSVAVDPQADQKTERHDAETSPEWALVYVTVVLVAVTAGLMIYTAFLWGATKSLAEDAKQTADRQARDMQTSLATAEKSANAAEKSAEVASKSLSIAQRAYVFATVAYGEPQPPMIGGIQEYRIWVEWENRGATPAFKVESWISWIAIPVNEILGVFHKNNETGSSTPLGPRAIAQTNFAHIPLAKMSASWRSEINIFVWARVEYKDMFEPELPRHHEQCMLLRLIGDPATFPPQGQRPYVQFIIYGPQNSAA